MIKKIVLFTLLALLLLVGGGLGFLFLRKPAMAPPSPIQVERTDARLARGKFLFSTLCDCDGCHSRRDFSRFDGPVIASSRGEGLIFPASFGLPGTVVAPNITPDKETGIGNWTDGEKIRAIRDGVGRDGRALFPMMPYTYYRQMSDEDVYSVVAYLDALPPLHKSLPPTKLNFPVNLLIKGVPRPVTHVPSVDKSDRMKYGEYLVTLGACVECHTQENRGQLVLAKRLAGGRAFRFPDGAVVSANITPDLDTGIGKWSEQQFLDKIYSYKKYVEQGSPLVGPESFTLMPWLNLSQMAPDDLRAIYNYLKAQPAIRNAVETHPGQAKTTTTF
jgi:hypothetical protein